MYLMFIPIMIVSLIYVILERVNHKSILNSKLFKAECVIIGLPLLTVCGEEIFEVEEIERFHDMNVAIMLTFTVLYLVCFILYVKSKSTVTMFALPVIFVSGCMVTGIMNEFWLLLSISTICFIAHVYIIIKKRDIFKEHEIMK